MLSMTVVKRYPVALFFGASVSIGWIVTIAAARCRAGRPSCRLWRSP